MLALIFLPLLLLVFVVAITIIARQKLVLLLQLLLVLLQAMLLLLLVVLNSTPFIPLLILGGWVGFGVCSLRKITCSYPVGLVLVGVLVVYLYGSEVEHPPQSPSKYWGSSWTFLALTPGVQTLLQLLYRRESMSHFLVTSLLMIQLVLRFLKAILSHL